jgi:ATP phosphoribosyltransferase regulatory subunit
LNMALADAPAALFQFAEKSGLTLDGALSRFDARVAALGNAGVDAKALTYRAAFGRPLDYYTGMVFEIVIEGSSAVLAGGGRFDRLMTLLGAKERIPAVGFALWLDRMEQALAKPQGEAAQ